MKAKHAALVQALDGMFTDHHGELAQLLVEQIAFLDERITQPTERLSAQLATIRDAWGIGPQAGSGTDAVVLAAARLDAIPGISLELAASIIAETRPGHEQVSPGTSASARTQPA